MDQEDIESRVTSDTLLWNNLRSGDDKSFEKIYRINVRLLYNYGSKFTHDKGLVLDCIQDVFIELFIHRKNLGETNNIRLYLFIALKRKILRAIQKASIIQSISDYELPFLSNYFIEDDVSEGLYEDEMLKELTDALVTLSPRQKEALYLRFISGLKYEEICQILELNYQSVRNLVHRALEKLRKTMVSLTFLFFLLQF